MQVFFSKKYQKTHMFVEITQNHPKKTGHFNQSTCLSPKTEGSNTEKFAMLSKSLKESLDFYE